MKLTIMKQALRFSTLIALIAITTFVSSACKSEQQKKEEADMLVDRPLLHDPTDKFEIGPWWSDGRHLLNLNADGSYALYDANNRYSRPMDRGRWGQQNYGTLWLEPYNRLQPQPTRVVITKIDGRLALQVPKLQPMYPLAGPPSVAEDSLIGDWQGPMGSLRLNADMTYTYTPASGTAPGGARAGMMVAGHNGRWKLEKDQVVLTPTTPSVAPQMLKVRQPPPAPKPADAGAGGTATRPSTAEPMLEGLGGELAKVKAASA